MVEGTPFTDHMIKMMGYLNELAILGVMLDGKSQVDMVLTSLPGSFNDFVINYHMNKLSMNLTELMNHLQSTEYLQKKTCKFAFLAEGSVSTAPKSKSREKERASIEALGQTFLKSRTIKLLRKIKLKAMMRASTAESLDIGSAIAGLF
ncbi:uncharacterized protein LOC143850372 [Tasmannia lanceolata]|uniref:uncharacterized protein LOC143850372 n=1 Tax=Tasmannia lanceolata TaxID=3420 RepID=UPI0040637EAD